MFATDQKTIPSVVIQKGIYQGKKHFTDRGESVHVVRVPGMDQDEPRDPGEKSLNIADSNGQMYHVNKLLHCTVNKEMVDKVILELYYYIHYICVAGQRKQ